MTHARNTQHPACSSRSQDIIRPRARSDRLRRVPVCARRSRTMVEPEDSNHTRTRTVLDLGVLADARRGSHDRRDERRRETRHLESCGPRGEELLMRVATGRSSVIALVLASTIMAVSTETEHHAVSVLPAPKRGTIDGGLDDRDLGGGVFVCGDVATGPGGDRTSSKSRRGYASRPSSGGPETMIEGGSVRGGGSQRRWQGIAGR